MSPIDSPAPEIMMTDGTTTKKAEASHNVYVNVARESGPVPGDAPEVGARAGSRNGIPEAPPPESGSGAGNGRLPRLRRPEVMRFQVHVGSCVLAIHATDPVRAAASAFITCDTIADDLDDLEPFSRTIPVVAASGVRHVSPSEVYCLLDSDHRQRLSTTIQVLAPERAEQFFESVLTQLDQAQ